MWTDCALYNNHKRSGVTVCYADMLRSSVAFCSCRSLLGYVKALGLLLSALGVAGLRLLADPKCGRTVHSTTIICVPE